MRNSTKVSEPRQKSRHTRNRETGFTLVELLVVAAILFVLISLVTPAVNVARESSRKIQCGNNLKLIGLGLHTYHDVFKRFPSAWTADTPAPDSGPYPGWQSSILPFMDMETLYDSLDFQSGPLNSETETLITSELSIYLCPSDVTAPQNHFRSGAGTSNYTGIFGSQPLPRLMPDRLGSWAAGAAPTPTQSNGLFFVNSGLRVADMDRGSTNVMMASERCVSSGAGLWFGVVRNRFENDQVTDCSFLSPINRSYRSLSSLHSGGVQVLMGDGSVSFISEDIETSKDAKMPAVFQEMATLRSDPMPDASDDTADESSKETLGGSSNEVPIDEKSGKEAFDADRKIDESSDDSQERRETF